MATIPANNNTGLYNTSGVPAVTGNDLTVSGNINANNVNAVNSITAGTNITAGGNVTADYFIGDGSLLTNINAGNIVGSYGNANVAAYLASGSNSSNVVTTGNVSGTYILGDGSQLTGLPATYNDANVNAHLAAFGSNTIVTTGNITGGYLFGNGSQLTGIASSYGNADVAAFLPTYTGNLAGGNGAITNDLVVGGTIYGTFSGNISGNLVVPGSNTQVLFNNNGNAGASADFTFNDATNLLTVAGNVNATAFNGSGAGLTSIPGANVTGTVPLATAATTAGTVTTAAQPNITSLGTLTSLATTGNVDVGGSLNTDDVTSTGNVTIFGNQVITGNLTVQGTTTTINSNTITTNDKTITVANNQSTGANVNGAGLEAGNPAVATFLYDDATTTWKSDIGLSAVGNITGSYIFGNGSQLTGLPATYTDANVNTHLAAFGSNTIVTTGNITGGNIIGNGQALTNLPGANVVGAVANATYATSAGTATSATTAGTVTTAAQPAITSVGTLTSLGVTGNITAGGILTDGYYYANGTPLSFGGTYGDSNVNTHLAALGSNAISSTANITTTANVSGAYVIGNGSALSSITGANVTGTVADASHATVADSANAVAGANVTGTVANATYATSAGSASTATTAGLATYVTGAAQANITSVGTLTSLAVTGNITGGNASVTGTLTAGGNISGNYLIGNIASATGGYSNAIAAAYLASGTNSSNIITTGNVTGTYLTTTGAAGNITGANYVTANYFVGNGSLLTGISATANLAGNLTGDLNGGNTYSLLFMNNLALSGAISNPAGDFVTIEGIQSSGSISATGNITGGNLIANGNVSGTYFIGNGSALTGLTTSLAGNLDGNINTGAYYITNPGAEVLMGNVWVTGTLAANSISSPAGDYVNIEGITTTNGLNSSGNVNALDQKSVNFYETGSTNYLGLKAPASVAADVVWTLPGTDGTTGQALSTYGNGVMYWATGGGGGGSPGGSDTQIQYNDGGAFGGNAAMTFNDTTGNIGLGNLIINAQQVQTIANANVALSSSIVPNPGRVVLGTGYNGNISPAYDVSNGGRSARFMISDTYQISDGNSQVRGAVVQNYYQLTGNVTSTNSRLGGFASYFNIGGGTGANTISGGATSLAAVAGVPQIGGGTSGNLTGMGNTIVQYVSGVSGIPLINTGSTVGNGYGSLSFFSNGGTANTAIGFGVSFQGAGAWTNTYGLYMPGGTNNNGITNANLSRNANYWFLKNEDNHAYNQVGQLKTYQETEYALSSSSGAVAVDKNNGQVQFFTVSEDATMSFSNFVVSSTVVSTTRYQTDTVTVIVQQDGTGRTITLPAASSTYKYAAGNNSVPTTADSVSMISITAIYNSVTAATQYLITISPEFS